MSICELFSGMFRRRHRRETGIEYIPINECLGTAYLYDKRTGERYGRPITVKTFSQEYIKKHQQKQGII